MTIVELRRGPLRLVLRPDLGGSIAGLWRGALPVLRSCEGAALASALESACYPLLPYSNRLGECRFEWLGRSYTTRRNVEGHPHSLHGVAWQRPWSVVTRHDDAAVLALAHQGDADWPFAFEARQSFALGEDALHVAFEFTNTASVAAPAGLGWHPFFAKRLRSRLHAELSQRWENDATSALPERRVPQAGIDAALAQLHYDHCFEGWSGPARLRDEALSLTLTASLSRLVVYTPQHEAWFCVEPVSHVSNAINMAEAEFLGLRVLQPGQTTNAWMKLEIADVHA